MLTALLLLAFSVCVTASDPQQNETETSCNASYCMAQGEWHLAVGLGLGVRTNPLYLSDNTPLVIIPDIAWYGENWYLDNTEVGYQWIQKPHFAMETYLTLNSAYGDFKRSHISNFILDGVNISNSVDSTTTPGLAPDNGMESINDRTSLVTQLSPADVADRDLAVDAGVRLHWYSEFSEWTLSAAHDISSVYQGAQLNAQYRRYWQTGDWKIIGKIGLTWKSADLLDYYYGINERDIEDVSLHYSAGSGWFPQIGVSANKKINAQWQWLLHASYNHLPSAMTDSPLVDKKYTITTFAGVTYKF
ncbi:MipA/OmpV family protein [Planctobacterium marinum]|nr:MipA/OmpV family protein [Planctobacterium marinum]